LSPHPRVISDPAQVPKLHKMGSQRSVARRGRRDRPRARPTCGVLKPPPSQFCPNSAMLAPSRKIS
jgi:hypothetical protein